MEINCEYTGYVRVLVIKFNQTTGEIYVIVIIFGVKGKVYDCVTQTLHGIAYTDFTDAFPFTKYYLHLTFLLGFD
jgi:hypothetical protein